MPRTTILAVCDRPDPLVQGIVKNGVRFDAALQLLQSAGYLWTQTSPKLVALHGQTATVQVGQGVGAQFRGIEFLARPTLLDDRCIELSIDLKMDNGPPNRSEMLQLKSTIVVEDRQTCFFGGLTRKANMSTITKLPLVGAWQRTIWYDEEVLVAATAHLVMSPAEEKKALEELSESP